MPAVDDPWAKAARRDATLARELFNRSVQLAGPPPARLVCPGAEGGGGGPDDDNVADDVDASSRQCHGVGHVANVSGGVELIFFAINGLAWQNTEEPLTPPANVSGARLQLRFGAALQEPPLDVLSNATLPVRQSAEQPHVYTVELPSFASFVAVHARFEATATASLQPAPWAVVEEFGWDV